jgi:hypothetical protein
MTPVPRSAEAVFSGGDEPGPKAPVGRNKWLTASVVDDAASVVGALFDEAERRDPRHERTWVALVDGNNHQIDRIGVEAKRRGVSVTVLIDVVHVLEYLWSAAWCFFAEGDSAAEAWVAEKATAILQGKAGLVAAAVRRTATNRHLTKEARTNADACADYLLHKRPYLDYPRALAAGWQIATGVIEGACRHLVKDRMDITGARWGLPGAEAVLKLRALRANDDLGDYLNFHQAQERYRKHESRYAKGVELLAA